MRTRLKTPRYSMIQNVRFWLNQSDNRDVVPTPNWLLAVYAVVVFGMIVWALHVASVPVQQV